MKKLIYCAAALATALFAGSCQQEMLDTTATETTVTYTVALPDAQTKAIGDAATVDELIYEVWKTETADERNLTDPAVKATRLYQDRTALVQRNGKTCAVVTFNLVQDQEYTILFWAQKAGTDVYNTDELTDVHYKYGCEPGSSNYFSNQENYAAFYAAAFVSDVDSKSRNITLKRPFAQLNIATKNTVKDYTVAMNTSKVTISKVATHFDVAKNLPTETAVSVPASFEFKTDYVPADPATITVNGQVYDYVAMNYVFAMGQNVTVDYEINTTLTAKNLDGSDGAKTTAQIKHTVPNVPLKENYRTNIVGNLLSSTTEYYIEIDNNWADAGDGTEVEVWDGLYAQEPPQVNGVYQISLASELAWLAKAVNGTLVERGANVTKSTGYVPAQTFAGKKFVLTQDIDLSHDVDLEGNRIDYGPALWTPIGVKEGHPFMGTFDGQGFTIKNLNVDMDKIVANQRNIQSDLIVKANDGAGLFGSCKTATVKNVTIKDATVKGHYKAAAVVADANCTYVDNCHVEDATIISTPYNNDDANNAGAIVGYLAGESAWAMVRDCSVKNAEVTAYRDVAAVVGRTNQKTQVLRNTVTNVEVVADQTPAYKEKKVGNAGKVIGYDVTNNCVMEGNVVDDATTAVVKVNTAEKLAWQANNAPSDVVIVFGSNISGDATITQQVGVNVTVDGCGKKYDGTIYLQGGEQGNSPETLTFKNINFDHNYGAIDFISANDAKNVGKRYAHNVTVEDCTFTGNYYGDVVPMRYRQTYNMTVKNCTANKVHSFLWATGGLNGIKISNVKSNGLNGVSFGTTANVVVENSEFNATAAFGYGIRVDASGAYKAQINNTKITAGVPVIMREATGAYEMNIAADSELTSTEVYQIIVASNDYAAGKTLAAPANNYVLNTNGVEYVVYPDAADLLMASSVETLKTAITAAKDGDTIYLMNGVYDGLFLVGAKNITLKAVNAHQAQIAGRICVAGSQESVLTCEDIHFAVSENTLSLFGNQYYDKTKGYVIGNYSGSITVKNCKFTGMTDDCGAIYYYSYDEGKATAEKLEKLIVEKCQFNGARAIRSRSNVSVTGSQFTGLENPCLQVLGLGDKDLPSTVVFTGNTSDVATSGVCIKTSNHATKNVTFNVAGNTNCNYIAFDSKNLANLYPETYTYTGEVNTLTPEDAAGLNKLFASNVAEITLAPTNYEGVFSINRPVAVSSVIDNNKATITGRINVKGNEVAALSFTNVKFAVNEDSKGKWTTGGADMKSKPSIVMAEANDASITFSGCDFDITTSAYAYTNTTSTYTTFDHCTFNGAFNYAMYVRANIEVTNCIYTTSVTNVLVGACVNSYANGKVIFANNTLENGSAIGLAGAVVFCSTNNDAAGKWAGPVEFTVKDNTGFAYAYERMNNFVVDPNDHTFTEGSERFSF